MNTVHDTETQAFSITAFWRHEPSNSLTPRVRPQYRIMYRSLSYVEYTYHSQK